MLTKKRREYFLSIKDYLSKPAAVITVNGKLLKDFALRFEVIQICGLLPLIFIYFNKSSRQHNEARKINIYKSWRGRDKTIFSSFFFYFAENKCICRKFEVRFVVCCCSIAKLCLTLCHPMDCSPSGSSVRVISQARILESVPIFFSRGSSQPGDKTCVSCISRQILNCLAVRGSPQSTITSY